jgi:hypothetical protein
VTAARWDIAGPARAQDDNINPITIKLEAMMQFLLPNPALPPHLVFNAASCPGDLLQVCTVLF